MELVFNLTEIAHIVVDHLVETGKLSDDDDPVLVHWSLDRYNGRNSKLIIEER